jgi:hypothetical protein
MQEWEKKENKVKTILALELKTRLEKQGVPLVGSEKGYKFDLVSPDKSTVMEVKTAHYNGTHPSTAIARLSDAALLLLGTDTKVKMLCLTDKPLYDLFVDSRQGRIAKAMGLQIRFVYLP